MKIRDRISEFTRVPAGELLPNPKNWRTHPDAQADALRGVLADVGFADAVLARHTENGLMLIDGHLRAEVAPDAEVPVLVLDVDEAEADKILATHDPLGGMAVTDAEKLGDLLREMEFDNAATSEMLAGLAADADLFDADAVEMPELAKDGERGMTTMTFVLTVEQNETVKAAIADAESRAADIETGNPNPKGNALALIAEMHLGTR